MTEEHLAWQRGFYDNPDLRHFVSASGLTDTASVRRRWASSGMARGEGSVIGFFCVAPNGRPLATVNDWRDRGGEQEMLRRALAAYAKLSPQERLLPRPPRGLPAGQWRWQNVIARKDVPAGLLVLQEFLRDTKTAPACQKSCSRYTEPPRGKYTEGAFKDNWNMDYVWQQDPGVFVPPNPQVGQLHPVPDWVPRHWARFHLVDSVHGRGMPFGAADVKLARMAVRVLAIDGDKLELRLEGQTRAEAKGVWQPAEVAPPEYQERGVDLQILGWLRYDRARGAFERFDVVANGTRWGTTESNRRYDVEFAPYSENRAPAPIGFAFRLFDRKLEESVPPGMLWKLGPGYFSKS